METETMEGTGTVETVVTVEIPKQKTVQELIAELKAAKAAEKAVAELAEEFGAKSELAGKIKVQLVLVNDINLDTTDVAELAENIAKVKSALIEALQLFKRPTTGERAKKGELETKIMEVLNANPGTEMTRSEIESQAGLKNVFLKLGEMVEAGTIKSRKETPDEHKGKRGKPGNFYFLKGGKKAAK